MSETRLWFLQRLTALVLAPLVIGHLAMIVYAVRGGLSAAEILGRTQGSLGWALFYGAFVLAAAVHGSIGIRNVLREWAGLKGPALNRLTTAIAVVLLVLGLRAVWAISTEPA